MNLQELTKPLPIDQIDFRIQSINKGGYATILAYKDARVDIKRLNNTCGPLGWKREHTRENHNCIVSIWDDDKKHWVSKEDTGTESNAEAQKGLASDSFKRACFNWGIGMELYDYPLIQVKLNSKEYKVDGQGRAKPTWELKLKSWIWHSVFNDDGVLMLLTATDGNGERFRWGLKPQPVIGDISGKVVDVKKVEAAYKMYKTEIDADKDEPDYARMQAGDKRLTDDERIQVAVMFGQDKPIDSKRLYKTILADCLKMDINQ